MDNTRIQNLLFLLAAAPMATGGCEISDSGDGGSGSTAGPQTTGVGTTEGPAETTTGGASVGQTGDTTAAPPETGGTTVATTDTTGGTGEPPPEVCVTYSDTVTYCYDKKAGSAALYACGEYAAQLYKDYGADCLTAFEDFYACLAGLDCRNFGPGTGCETELGAFDTACFGAGTGTGG